MADEFDKPKTKYVGVPPSQKRHGMSYTKIYRAWQQLKNRCLNKKDKGYKHYGERGITVCFEWINSFENFYKDMGNPPTLKHSIDRIDNNGNYCKSNCRWATRYEQNMNRSITKKITIDGTTKTLVELAKEKNINENTLRSRLRNGFTIDLLFTKKYDPRLYHNRTSI